MATKVTEGNTRKLLPEMYVTIYELARAGETEAKICETLNININSWQKWKQKYPAVKDAYQRGHKLAPNKQNPQNNFAKYLYGKLPSHLKGVWDRLELYAEIDDSSHKVDLLLEPHGTKAKQHLFVYALVKSNFSHAFACRATNISNATLQRWKHDDEGFRELIQEIHFHKGNFFEDALMAKVKEGDTSTILHVNKTYNKDRGYGDKLQIDHTGEVKVTHQHIHVHLQAIKELNLPIHLQEQVLTHVRQQKAQLQDIPGGLPRDSSNSEEK